MYPLLEYSKNKIKEIPAQARQKAHAKQTLGNPIRAQASSIQHPAASSQQPLRQSVSGKACNGGVSKSPGSLVQESWTASSFRTSEITSDYVLLQICMLPEL